MTHPLSCLVETSIAGPGADPAVGAVSSIASIIPGLGPAAEQIVTNAGAKKTRIAGIHARIRTHYEAVKQAEAEIGAEPELVEYVARWRAFMREMNDLGERADSTFSWVSDSDIDKANADLNDLLREWERLSPTISLRKTRRVREILEGAAPRLSPRDPEEAAPTPVRAPETRVRLPESAASRAPESPAPPPAGEPPGAPLAIRAAALFTLAAATVAATAAVKSDGQRAAAAGGGLLLTGAAAWAMFWPASAKEKEKKS